MLPNACKWSPSSDAIGGWSFPGFRPIREHRVVAMTMRIHRLVKAAFVAAFACLAFSPSQARAQSGWTVGISGERSSVSLGTFATTWSAEALEVKFVREASGGWLASLERQERTGRANYTFSTRAYRRLGDWTIGGGAAGTNDATFWFRRSFDGELSRRVVGTFVASAAYRYLDFPSASVHQVQPALTWYNPRGELQARLYATRNTTVDRTSYALLLRSAVRLNPRVALSGALAVGDRIFDMAALARGSTRGWTTRAGVRLNVTPRNELEVGGGYSRENPAFRQRTVAIAYRRAF
jgi:YaiO family outer membrane protein